MKSIVLLGFLGLIGCGDDIDEEDLNQLINPAPGSWGTGSEPFVPSSVAGDAE